MATVLVVDDEPDIRQLVRLNLELDGHTVIGAADGAEALRHAERTRPDCVVLDIVMPEVDGWQVLEAMKTGGDPRLAEIPVILLTARSQQVDRIRGGIEGAVRYLTKPFSGVELRAEVAAALSGDPEPEQRRRAQTAALQELARLERRAEESADDRNGPTAPALRQPRLTRLDGAGRAAAPAGPPPLDAQKVAALSERQREVLRAVAATASVNEAAERLGSSRSNVYATLGRIARRVDADSVATLVARARDGGSPTTAG